MAPVGVIDEAVRWMTALNAAAAGLMLECEASACTDVTGFGLVGHACEMARGAGVTLEIALDDVPLMGGVMGLLPTASCRPAATATGTTTPPSFPFLP